VVGKAAGKREGRRQHRWVRTDEMGEMGREDGQQTREGSTAEENR